MPAAAIRSIGGGNERCRSGSAGSVTGHKFTLCEAVTSPLVLIYILLLPEITIIPFFPSPSLLLTKPSFSLPSSPFKNYWYFYQDGHMEFEIKLTGQLSTNALSPGEETPAYGILVDPSVNAQHHQHMFCARLDMAVDDLEGGQGLEVVEQEVEAIPRGGINNPFGNGFRVKETVLKDEVEAQRVGSAATARSWVVRNPKVRNRLGQAVGYKIVVPENPLILASADSLVARKGAFATKNLWVTPYKPTEMWPAGDYPTQSAGGGGLPVWTRQKRSVQGVDVVVWPCYGLTHVVRTEDFGTMPVEMISIKIKPVSFFDRNPAQNLPVEKNKASVEAMGERGCCGGNPTSPPN